MFKGNYKFKILLGLSVLALGFFLLPFLALAQASLGLDVGTGTGLGTRDLKELIVSVVQILLGFLGIVAVIILMYGGFVWMTAAGDADKVSRGKRIVISMSVGVAIILSAYLIVSYVLGVIQGATGGNNGNINDGGDNGGPGANGNIFRVTNISPLGNLAYRNLVVQINLNQNVDPDSLTNSALIIEQANIDGNFEVVNGSLTLDIGNASRVIFTPATVCEINPNEHCFFYSATNQNLNRHRIRVVSDPAVSFRSVSNLPITCLAGECIGEFITGGAINNYPDYCFNGIFDDDIGETGIDCGGECGACNGERCSTNALACEPDNQICASNLCSESCFCVSQPIITTLDPDNGKNGNLITILGRDFGSQAGHVFFNDTEALLPNQNDCSVSWSDNQIIAVVPEGLAQEIHQVKIVTSGNLESNYVDFLVNDIERPGICLVNPDAGDYKSDFTINGIQFGNVNDDREVIFGNNFSALETVWQDNRVNAQVPNLQAGNSSVKVRVNDQISNSLRFNIEAGQQAEAVINYFTPTLGGENQYVTIYGNGFGDYVAGLSQVKFSTDKLGSFSFPNECGNNFWNDNYIVVKVPREDEVGNLDDGPITVITANGQIAVSANDFNFNSNLEPTPGICSLNPASVSPGDTFEIAGEGFNNSSVYLNNQEIDNSPDNNNFFNDVAVPNNVQTGPVTVRRGDQISNSVDLEIINNQDDDNQDQIDYYQWQFTTCADCQVPQVVIRASCQDGIIASPNPRPNSSDNFTNGLISATFNTNMSEADFVLNRTVVIKQCGSGEIPADCTSIEAAGDFNFYPSEDNFEFYFTLALNNNLNASTWYQVILDSSLRSNRVYPDGLHERLSLAESFGDGTYGDQAGDGWYFKTRNQGDQICTGTEVAVSPPHRLDQFGSSPIELNSTVTYSSQLYNGANCNLCGNNFNWQWQSSQENNAVLDGNDPNPNNNQKNVFAAGLTQSSAIITASAINAPGAPVGEGDLDIVDGDPRVVMQNECELNPPASPIPYPNYQEACINVTPTVKFNKLMDPDTLTIDNFQLYSCDGENCDTAVVVSSIDLISGMIGGVNGMIGARLITQNNLNPDTNYQVRLLRDIASLSGRYLVGLDSWDFKTRNSNQECIFSSIIVDPTVWRFNASEQTKDYQASGQGASCQILRDNPAVNWAWRSENAVIASINSVEQNTAVVASTDQEGETRIRASVNNLENQGDNGKVISDFSPLPLILRLEEIRPSGNNVCLNALAQVRSNLSLNQATVNNQTIKIFKQQDNDWQEVNLDLNLGLGNTVISFIPSAQNHWWEENAIYQIRVLGGLNGIRSSTSEFLEQSGCVQPLNWDGQNNLCQSIFATGNEACRVSRLLIEPFSATTTVGSFREFIGTPLADNGQALSNQIDNWQSFNHAIADVNLIDPNNTHIVRVSGLDVGSTNIVASLPDEPDSQIIITGSAELEVLGATVGPSVVDVQPIGNNVCRNTALILDFDSLLNPETINNINVAVEARQVSDNPVAGCTREITTNNLFKPGSLLAKLFNQIIGQVYDIGLRLVANKAQADNYWCPVAGSWSVNNAGGQARLSYNLNDLLPSESSIRMVVKGGDEGVKGINGLNLTGDLNAAGNFVNNFTASDQRCDVNFVNVVADQANNSSSWIFTTSFDNQADNDLNSLQFDTANDADKLFTVQALSAQGTVIQSIPGYEWNWQWSTTDDSIAQVFSSNNEQAIINAQNKNGQNLVVATAVFTDQLNANKNGSAQVRVDLCENRWNPENNEDPAYRFIDPQYNFALSYCLDYGAEGTDDDLPVLSLPREGQLTGQQPKEDFFLRDYILTVPDNGDVIGVRVFTNNNHYFPSTWYSKNFDSQASPTSLNVDGYQAVRDGRSFYISAANVNPNVNPERHQDDGNRGDQTRGWLKIFTWLDKVFANSANAATNLTDLTSVYQKVLDAQLNSANVSLQSNQSELQFLYLIPANELRQLLQQQGVFVTDLQSISNNDLINNWLLFLQDQVQINANFDNNTFNPNQQIVDIGFNNNAFNPNNIGIIQPGYNVVGVNSGYTNIYLLSYNQNASPETLAIVDGLLSNLEFNTNIDNPQIKDKIRNDVKRLADLQQISSLLDNYQDVYNGQYPSLAGGTFLNGVSTSKWPSWSQTFASAVGAALPVDPINHFNSCTNNNNGYDRETCWNPSANNNTGAFACDANSYFYLYRNFTTRQGVPDYTLAAKFEATTNWQPANGLNPHWAISLDRVLDNRAPTALGCTDQAFGSFCGDGVINGNEQCEPGMSRNWCPQGFSWYNPVIAGCDDSCNWINPFDANVTPADCGGFCGDAYLNSSPAYRINVDEQCDASASVNVRGFGAGTSVTNQYLCSGSCIDTGGWCGDGRVQINSGEVCDGVNGLSGYSCTEPNGQPVCGNNCATVTCTAGELYAGRCGNNIIETPEVCDGLARLPNAQCALDCSAQSNRPGFADCDDNLQNGYEVNLNNNNNNNCGACGTVCNVNSSVCQSGQCVNVCPAGYLSCDEDFSDGCEIDSLNDNNNCGACGSACSQGQNCVQGACERIITCGDGVIEGLEVCDDADRNGDFGFCNNSCDGMTSLGEPLFIDNFENWNFTSNNWEVGFSENNPEWSQESNSGNNKLKFELGAGRNFPNDYRVTNNRAVNLTDVDILTQIDFSLANDDDALIIARHNGSNNWQAQSYYALWNDYNNYTQIRRINADGNIHGVSLVQTNSLTDGNYWFQFRVYNDGNGVRLKARWWQIGTIMPNTWNLEFYDTSNERLNQAGKVGLAGWINTVFYFDNFQVYSVEN